MFIQDLWDNYAGVSDEALSFIEYLESTRKREFTVTELFDEIGLSDMGGDFKNTDVPLGVEIGELEINFPYAIDIVTVIAAIVLECRNSEAVNLNELNPNCEEIYIKVTASDDEYVMLTDALADFVDEPESFDLAEMMDEDELSEHADGIKEMLSEM